jgi:hypothetical protein
MIGESRSMGWGVEQETRFETLLERRLNDERPGASGKNYEILNFSLYGYVPAQRLITFEEKALRFRPDAVIYISGLFDLKLEHHAQMVRRGVAMPYEFLNVINRKAGIDASMSEAEIVRRLYPYRYELASQVYNHFGEVARERGMPIIWIHIPSMSDNRADVDELRRLAESAGFATLDLSKTYDPAAFRISRWDGHPNPQGHRLIANSIYEHLKTLQEVQRANMDLPQAEAQN